MLNSLFFNFFSKKRRIINWLILLCAIWYGVYDIGFGKSKSKVMKWVGSVGSVVLGLFANKYVTVNSGSPASGLFSFTTSF